MALSTINTNSIADDAVTVPKVTDQVLTHKNLIINGKFQIFQRATSATNPGGGYDTADRWRSSQNSGGLGNYNAEQSTDTPVGFANSYKLTNTSATTQSANVSAYFEQYFEGQNVQHLNYGSSSAVKLTASFHVKSSVTGIYGCFLGDGESGKSNVQTYTINSANTWEKKVVTFNGDTQTALANDSSKELAIGFVLGAGTSYQTSSTNTWASGGKLSTSSQTQWKETNGATFFLTGVQLEVGDTATPFEHRSFGDELARCQRYYVQQRVDIQTPAGGSMIVPIYFPTTMRATPAVSAVSAGGGNIATAGVVAGGTQSAYLQVASSANSNYILGRIDAYTAEL